MKRVLIMTSEAGAGHTSVARALATGLRESKLEQVTVEIGDPFAIGQRTPVGEAMRTYPPMLLHWPGLWGGIYRLTNYVWLTRGVCAVGGGFCGPGTGRLLERIRPDVVVSSHPFCHHLAIQHLRRASARVPVVVVLTDLACIHAFWKAPLADLYLSPSPEAENELRRLGVAPERIRRVGLPVDPRFGQVDTPPAALRERLGLDTSRFTVLLVGGGEGAGGLERAALAIGRSGLDLQMLVVCGRNRRLRSRLAAADLGVPARVYGFVDNMPELMGAADVVATKAGSVSLAEAMAAGRPVLVIHAVPGQETGNIPFVESRGAGRVATRPEALVAEVARLYADPAALQAMAQRARSAGHPRSAHAAAEEILRRCP